jgi:hypothetical protein
MVAPSTPKSASIISHVFVVQRIEYFPAKEEIVSSSLTENALCLCISADGLLRFERRGRGFESCQRLLTLRISLMAEHRALNPTAIVRFQSSSAYISS